MAVTKIHPIKSTLKKALDYITNPVKTDDKLYVSSFGCAVETADIEFEKTRLRAMNKGNNLAHHLIQAFEPGEVTPEAAHEIGRQLADSILGGKYEYVLTTHIDKGHVHNHLIFCSVDFAEYACCGISFLTTTTVDTLRFSKPIRKVTKNTKKRGGKIQNYVL